MAFGDGARLASYRDRHGAASPTALLHERLKQRLVHAVCTSGTAMLSVDVQEFWPVFDVPAKSRALMRLRTTLLEANSGDVARALVRASYAGIARVLAWVATAV